jgi:hypothetical protein
MKTLVEALCSERCAGRAPGPPEGAAARAEVVAALRGAGLDPFEQPVPGCRGANVLATLPGRTDRWVMLAAHLEGLVGAGTPASVFLTLLGGHLQKLHAVLAALDRGENFDGAVARLRPPLHFQQKDAMRAQTGRWRLPEVAAAIAAAQETLRQTRLKPALEDALAATLILRLCRAGKQRAA